MPYNNRILVIDDEKFILDTYLSILTEKSPALENSLRILFGEDKPDIHRKPFLVDTALQGEAGFSKVKHRFSKGELYSVIFTDMRMPPGWDGLQTVKAIHKHDPFVLIVIVTAFSDVPIETIVSEVGETERLFFLKKPFEREEILQLALSLCTRWNLNQADRRAKQEMEDKIQERTMALQQANASLLEAQAKAIAANESKSLFLANMSHEIRTPMNAIIGLSHLALGTDLSAQQEDYLQKIQSSSHLLLGIINDILDFSKIEAGKLEFENIRFSLGKVLSTVSTLLIDKVQNKGLEIIFSQSMSIPKILVGDPLRLGQVITNLLKNAIKFTDHGEIVVSSEIVQKTKDHITLRFSVKDTGIGLTSEEMNKLFRPFSQADASTTRKYGGTGLGLAISKRLVEIMHGEIGGESETGKGSTFFFTAVFELDQEKEADRQIDQLLIGKRVLVVDDSETSSAILLDILTSLSFVVSSVNSGDKAIKELDRVAHDPNEQNYDLVLMDWRMPGMDGLETTQKIQNDLGLPNVPLIIMVTAYDRAEVMRQLKDAVLDGFLLKPITPSVLLDTIMFAFDKTEAIPVKTKHVSGVNFQGVKILLVEDNEINQQVAREILEGEGCEVSIADNGKVALAILKTTAFDLVLMDIQMPVMDGYQATHEIREDSRFNQLPIVAMTANAMKGDKEQCLLVGMNDHLAKPIDVDNLRQILCRWIKPESLCIQPIKSEQPQTDAVMMEIPGINLALGLQRVRQNRSLFLKLLKTFYQNYHQADLSIEHAIHQSDWESARSLSHSLKGVAGNLGAESLHIASGALDSALRQRDVNSEVLSSFKISLQEVMQGLEPLSQQTSVTKLEHNGVNVDKLTQIVQHLRELVQKRNSKAGKCLQEFKENFGKPLAADLQALEEFIENFEFKSAEEVLDKIAQELDLSGDEK